MRTARIKECPDGGRNFLLFARDALFASHILHCVFGGKKTKCVIIFTVKMHALTRVINRQAKHRYMDRVYKQAVEMPERLFIIYTIHI